MDNESWVSGPPEEAQERDEFDGGDDERDYQREHMDEEDE